MKELLDFNILEKETKAIFLVFFVLNVVLLNSLSFKNEIKTRTNLFEKKSSQQYHLGISYKPEIYREIIQKESFSLDLETIVNLSFQNVKNDKKTFSETAADFYRGWIRFNAEKYEIRFGLQQVNFGPAFLLRSLKWFDLINPQDPLAETEGVTSLLFRYFFLNNANIWFWSLLGQNEIKDLEMLNSKDNSLEFGGRFQYPFKICESALSFHHRKLENSDYDLEFRFGFDSRFDLLIGFWLETFLSRFEGNENSAWTKMFTFGADYTLPFLNGIHFLAEHQNGSQFTTEISDFPKDLQLSAISADFATGFFSKFRTIFSYDWISENWYRFISYQMSFDYWSFYMNFLWNPQNGNIDYEEIYFDGKSVQLMIVVNF